MLTLDNLSLLGQVGVVLAVAFLLSFILTPPVKSLAVRVGAVDIPKDERRMHKMPIPRLGGLAIFLAFMICAFLFVPMTTSLRGLMLGATIIVVLGVIDDIYALPALPKFLIQIAAALVTVLHGNVITVLSNPNVLSDDPYWVLGSLSVPITVIWIVALTNAVNLIDGLDGLAVGVSTISALTLLVISLLVVTDLSVTILVAVLAGSCMGFMPYNLNPAKIFMGDTGATFLGFVLAAVSVQGLFKFYAIFSFAVPLIMLGLPIFDTAFAIFRRILKRQNPMRADRSHVHHRLIDMGCNQKQAVAILYLISALLGLWAVVLTISGERSAAIVLLFIFLICFVIYNFYQPKKSITQESNEAAGEGGVISAEIVSEQPPIDRPSDHPPSD